MNGLPSISVSVVGTENMNADDPSASVPWYLILAQGSGDVVK
jgi:hypothetical protein